MPTPLAGLLAITIDQAVAAPMTSRKLADAGARVIKIERPEGDFARGYDRAAAGQSSYFVWLNRGKESVRIDLAAEADKRLFEALITKADIFLQNLKPGAMARLGYPLARLRALNPRLVTCAISGYGETGPYAQRKAYDLLIQAESGLASVTGGPDAASRVGVSVVDIATGMNAYEAILEALILRERTGTGADISVSMFDAMAEWMTVPLLHGRAGNPPKRIGLAHPSVAPYGVFDTGDGAAILISIQNDREWVVLARDVVGDAGLAGDARFSTNVGRVQHRAEVDARLMRWFAGRTQHEAVEKLLAADIAFGRVSTVDDLAVHPHLREIALSTPNGPVAVPAPPAQRAGEEPIRGEVPALGAHTEAIRAEFLGA